VKAAVCREFNAPLVIEELEIAPPGASEIEVRIAACAICHSDIHYMEGAWGGTLPAVYGHEAAGIVERVGSAVAGLEVGDHVVVTLIRSCGRCSYCTCGAPVHCDTRFPLDQTSPLVDHIGATVAQGLRTGAFAERVVVEATQAVAVPHDIPLESASLLACGVITGLGAVTNTAKVPAGASVVVIGTGGVGLNSVQGARLSGADPIIAVDLAASKRAAAERFGATHTIDPAGDDARAVVKSLTGGHGADYVFVTVGAKAAYQQGLGLLARTGTLIVVGMPPSGVCAEVEIADFAYRGQRIIGSLMGSSRISVDIPKLVSFYRSGRLMLDELITGRFPLARINEAIASVGRGETLRNVIIF